MPLKEYKYSSFVNNQYWGHQRFISTSIWYPSIMRNELTCCLAQQLLASTTQMHLVFFPQQLTTGHDASLHTRSQAIYWELLPWDIPEVYVCDNAVGSALTYWLYNTRTPNLYSMIRMVHFLLLTDMITHSFTTVCVFVRGRCVCISSCVSPKLWFFCAKR